MFALKMNKFLTLTFLSTFLVATEDYIELICEYVEGSEVRTTLKSATFDFTDEKISFQITPSEKKAIINTDSYEYFSEVKPFEIIISTRLQHNSAQDLGKLFGFYEYIRINRETGKLLVKNYTKQNETDSDESYPEAFTKEYECRALNIKF